MSENTSAPSPPNIKWDNAKMITLEDFGKHLVATERGAIIDLSQMLYAPNPFLEDYKPAPRTFWQRAGDFWSRVGDAWLVLRGKADIC